jgi:dolichol-phosphate mannosyltransferase
MGMAKTLIFIPTYNEAENVGPMCMELLAQKLDADILFVDDSSPDGTGAVLDKLAAEHPRVRVNHRSGKAGIGSAHQFGIGYAYDHGYTRLVTMDCDFTHSPADIKRLLEASEHADWVVGSRFLSENSLPGWSPVRKALTHLGHFATDKVLGFKNDATGAFRVYRLDRVPRALFGLVGENGYAFFYKSLFIAHENGCKIVDVPIVLPARTVGHSKMDMTEIKRSLTQLGTLYFERSIRPSQFHLSHDVDFSGEVPSDASGWDAYWDKKSKAGSAAYDTVAAIYRNLFIKTHLTRTINKEFSQGVRLLHAGCGSGQVDANLHDHARITAIDISDSALRRYAIENPRAEAVKKADILNLPFADGTFDGAYNLGVVEHFEGDDLIRAISEMRRVTKKGGKLVFFWPHRMATSAMVLDSLHYVLNDVLHKGVSLHPPEVTRVANEAHAREILEKAGVELASYSFGPQDLFIQAIVVGRA